jgi:hypothetical protein
MKIKKIECQQNLVFQIEKIANSITDKRELEGNFNCNRKCGQEIICIVCGCGASERETKRKC